MGAATPVDASPGQVSADFDHLRWFDLPAAAFTGTN